MYCTVQTAFRYTLDTLMIHFDYNFFNWAFSQLVFLSECPVLTRSVLNTC